MEYALKVELGLSCRFEGTGLAHSPRRVVILTVGTHKRYWRWLVRDKFTLLSTARRRYEILGINVLS